MPIHITPSHEQILAMGRLISKEFDGVDPKYMLRDSVRIEAVGVSDKASLSVTLRKLVDLDTAEDIINGRERPSKGDND